MHYCYGKSKHFEVSLMERLSSPQRVLYQRFHCIHACTYMHAEAHVQRNLRERDSLPTKDAILDPFPIAAVHF